MDKTIEKILGSRDGSGMGFGQRDMDWCFSKKKDALAAFNKLKGKGLELCSVDVSRIDKSKEWDDNAYSIEIESWKA